MPSEGKSSHCLWQGKLIISVLKKSAYLITSIAAHPIGLAAIIVIMSVSTLKFAVILYIQNVHVYHKFNIEF